MKMCVQKASDWGYEQDDEGNEIVRIEEINTIEDLKNLKDREDHPVEIGFYVICQSDKDAGAEATLTIIDERYD
jgi:hypothetical protein